jgi:hypothetical protein
MITVFFLKDVKPKWLDINDLGQKEDEALERGVSKVIFNSLMNKCIYLGFYSGIIYHFILLIKLGYLWQMKELQRTLFEKN